MKAAKKNNQLSRKIQEKIQRARISEGQKKVLSELMAEPFGYIPDDRFNRPTVMGPIMEEQITVTPGVALDKEEEVALFLQMNYVRHRLCQQRRKLLRSPRWQKKELEALLDLYQQQLELRSQIVTANMGLVLAMAKRTNYEGVEFNDLISEGSMALLRATEKYDCGRGLKFSTYACRAIFKAFSRTAKTVYKHRNAFPVHLEPSMERDDSVDQKREEIYDEMVDEVRSIIKHNMAELSQMEQSVVEMRFSLEEKDRQPMTLKEVGEILGLTKERIRQIQNKALGKLREVAEERLATA